MRQLRIILTRSNLTLPRALLLFGLAVVSMGGFLFTQTLGIDDELNLFQPGEVWTWFRQGRFLIGAAQWLIPQSVTPLFPYLLLGCSYVITHALLLACHGLQHSWRSDLAFLAFILFPTNWLSQEFVINVPGFALGLLAIGFASVLSLRLLASGGAARLQVGTTTLILGLLVVGIGGFQSLITLYLVIGTGVALFHSSAHPLLSEAERPLLRPARILTWFASLSLAAIVLHSLLLKLFLVVSHSQLHQIDRYFRSPYFMLRTQPLKYIQGNIDQFLRTYFTPGFFYGHSLFAFTFLLIGCVFIYALACRRGLLRPALAQQLGSVRGFVGMQGWALPLVFLLLMLQPLLLNLVSTPYRIPMRALMALPYLAWLAVIFWLEMAERFPSPLLRWGGVVLSGLLAWQCLIATSNYYAARQLNFRSDQLVAASIVSAIIESGTPPGRPSSTAVRYLATSGSLQRDVPYRTAWYSTAGSSFFNWDNGSSARMIAWLRAMGVDGLEPLPDPLKQRLNSVLAGMPAWPQPGSIRVVDQAVLVRFGAPAAASIP